MAQTLFKASGLNAGNSDTLKNAGMGITGVHWVNINNDNVLVTHDDHFDGDVFIAALQGADGSVTLSKG